MGSQRWSGGLPSLCSRSWQTQTRLRKSCGSPRAKGDVYNKSVEKNRSRCCHALRTASVSHFDPCVPLVPDLLCQPCGGSRVPRRAQLGTVPWWLRRCPQQGEAALPGAWLRPCGCVCALAGLGNALGFGALGRAGKHTRAGIMGQPLPRCRSARSDARGPDGLVPAPCLLFCSHLGPNLGGRGQQVPHGPPQGWQRCRHKTRGLRLLREPTAACPLHQSPQRGGEAQMRLEKPRGEAAYG